jgi:hypothetical protein
MNNILFWWTVRVLFCYTDLSSAFIAYFITVNLYNVYDFVETVRSAVHTRKGKTHRWYLYSTTCAQGDSPPVHPKLLGNKQEISEIFFVT